MNAPAERLFFNSFVEALIIRAYGPKLSPRLKERLRALELDLDRPLEPGYRAELLVPWLGVLCEELHPEVSAEEAQQRLGRRFIAGWKETFIGRALVPLVKLLPAKRALGRMERNFRSTDNFSRITVVDRGPNTVDLEFADVCQSPSFFLGLLDEGATISSAKNPRSSLFRFEAPGAVFRCEWEG